MSSTAAARTASDLTSLVTRLGRAGRTLLRQSRLPEEDFGGLSGDAYRRHASRSADSVAGAASDLALLAGALAAFGRELASAEEIRDQAAASPPGRARELQARAHDVEHRAQKQWRAAVATFEGRNGPPVARSAHAPVAPSPRDPPVPSVGAPVSLEPPAVHAAPAAVAPASPAPVLESGFVVPPPQLESELVVPAVPTPHCGTPEAIDEHG